MGICVYLFIIYIFFPEYFSFNLRDWLWALVNILSQFLRVTFNHTLVYYFLSTLLGTGDTYKEGEMIIALNKSTLLRDNFKNFQINI